jgi:putative ABC transport system permease protein
MRPPAPPAYRRGTLARCGLERALPLVARMVVRNLERRPLRALLSVVAIALAVAIVIIGIFTVDAVHYLTDVQFDVAQRQDLTIGFKEPESRTVLHEVVRTPGVMRVEPVRAVPVRIRHGRQSRRVAITGVSAGATLARVIDTNLVPVQMPSTGLVLNGALASALDVGRGEPVDVEVLEGARAKRTAVVSAIVPEYLGVSAYMDIDALNRLVGEGPVVSGAYLQIDTPDAQALYARLKRTPGIGTVTISGVARRSFQETIAEVITTVTSMFAIFGAAIAFAVIYNNNRIAFSERARELSSLHVLGFSHAEMAEIILGEMAILTVVAIPAGVLVGRVLASLVVVLFSTELARIPVVIDRSTYGIATAITLASAIASGVATWRQILRLDVVSALKAPE